MLSKLIELTNSKTFFDNRLIRTKSLSMTRSSFTMDFLIVDNFTEQVYFKCNLQAHDTAYSTGFRMIETGIGYRQINIYESHPALWVYQDTATFQLHGPVKDLSGFLGDLYLTHQEVSGNWIDFHRIVYGMSIRLSSNLETLVELPKPLTIPYLAVFQKYNLNYEQIDTRSGDEQYKVLIVGNEGIAPDELNLSQPFMVAKSFSATMESMF